MWLLQPRQPPFFFTFLGRIRGCDPMQEQLHVHNNHFHCFVLPPLPVCLCGSIGGTSHTQTHTGVALFSPVQPCFRSREQRKQHDLNSSLTFDDWVLWL